MVWDEVNLVVVEPLIHSNHAIILCEEHVAKHLITSGYIGKAIFHQYCEGLKLIMNNEWEWLWIWGVCVSRRENQYVGELTKV